MIATLVFTIAPCRPVFASACWNSAPDGPAARWMDHPNSWTFWTTDLPPRRPRAHPHGLMDRNEIPRFFLYGEPPRHVGDRFLHLEELGDRSRPANWNIRPHSHADLHHAFHITVGGGEMRADSQTLVYDAPCLILVPAGTVHGFVWA